MTVPARPPVIAVAGPTGSGKSRLAIALAQRLGGEIVNYDSVQVYRGFDIGSAKPRPEEREIVPHHLFDVVDADQEFNASDFAALATRVIDEIRSRGKLAILAGGTGFYLRALLAGLPEMPGRDESIRARLRPLLAKPRGRALLRRLLERVDPVSAGRIADNDRHRTERALEVWLATGRPISSWERPTGASGRRIDAIVFALALPREELRRILDARVEAMYRDGLVDETRALLEKYPEAARPFSSIGYREAVRLLAGAMPLDEAIDETKRRTRAYAKRQITWLRSEQNVHWIDATAPTGAQVAAVLAHLESRPESRGV